ncbi:MAG TPA: hypothetical protein VFR70_11630, partial [Flavobacterium sp.]|nr:hypothetical protein [Flavobacterium sp.]
KKRLFFAQEKKRPEELFFLLAKKEVFRKAWSAKPEQLQIKIENFRGLYDFCYFCAPEASD